jgi:radical SAM superfamily enzyme YgiQ (UPF0313 family)
MKKVMLIQPWIEDFSAYDFWIKPLGLLTIGTVLKRAGHHVELIDCLDRAGLHSPDKRYRTGKIPSVEIPHPTPLQAVPRKFKRFGMPESDFRARLSAFGRPDLVLVTCMMTYWYTGAQRAIRIAKEIYPGVPVGLGGNYVTLCPGHAAEYAGADFLVPEKDPASIIRKIQEALRVDSLHVPSPLPFPDFSFYPELRSISLITSKGCPFRCSYCAVSRLYPDFSQENPERVLRTIVSYVREYNVQDVAFFDDALLIHAPVHLHPILQGILEEDVHVRFHLPNAVHAKAVTKKTAGLFFRAGFKTIRLGLESNEADFQRECSSGKINNRKFRQAVRHLQTVGFTSSELGAYVLFGIPGQREEEVLDTMKMVYETGVRSYLSTYSPVPGTPDFARTARRTPQILHEPLLHNKHLCCYNDPDAYHRIKDTANRLNQILDLQGL